MANDDTKFFTKTRQGVATTPDNEFVASVAIDFVSRTDQLGPKLNQHRVGRSMSMPAVKRGKIIDVAAQKGLDVIRASPRSTVNGEPDVEDQSITRLTPR